MVWVGFKSLRFVVFVQARCRLGPPAQHQLMGRERTALPQSWHFPRVFAFYCPWACVCSIRWSVPAVPRSDDPSFP